MRARPPDGRRVVPVRLTDIPLEQRLHAARAACLAEPDEDERRLIVAAAVQPSTTVYWVAPARAATNKSGADGVIPEKTRRWPLTSGG